MQQAPPPLLPLLRSPFQGNFLAWLFLHPEYEFSLTELAERFGVSRSTAMREANHFVAAGLVGERRQGNLRFVRARTDNVVTSSQSVTPMTTTCSTWPGQRSGSLGGR